MGEVVARGEPQNIIDMVMDTAWEEEQMLDSTRSTWGKRVMQARDIQNALSARGTPLGRCPGYIKEQREGRPGQTLA